MARNKVVIGVDVSVDAQRVLDAENSATQAASELTMIRRRIRTFFTAITQVRFPANPPSWAENWPEWLETGEVAEVVSEDVAEVPAETPVEETLAP